MYDDWGYPYLRKPPTPNMFKVPNVSTWCMPMSVVTFQAHVDRGFPAILTIVILEWLDPQRSLVWKQSPMANIPTMVIAILGSNVLRWPELQMMKPLNDHGQRSETSTRLDCYWINESITTKLKCYWYFCCLSESSTCTLDPHAIGTYWHPKQRVIRPLNHESPGTVRPLTAAKTRKIIQKRESYSSNWAVALQGGPWRIKIDM